ncbi:hypothetical protein SAMN05443551_3031 [Marivita hallyeonensis]|uniref:Matrixin n=1 Tax=Marivita hallyeonensis TaxID=996342 RepID=A0A1M5VRH0_9RHOB|nr:hypothetical protein SAMN05443551_3031 [Marivita hallyeonensis]
MPTPWKDTVRASGRLKIHCTDSLVGDWRSVVADAMTEFNSISTRGTLGVSFVDEAAEDQANVIVWNVDGTRSTSFAGTTTTVNLRGNASAGNTRTFSIGGRMEMAHVFLPSTPGQYSQMRALGRPVRLVIAFHELIHCCGLHNDDHGGLAFHGHPSATRARNAADDVVSVQTENGYVHMPPLVITPETGRRIRANWTSGE